MSNPQLAGFKSRLESNTLRSIVVGIISLIGIAATVFGKTFAITSEDTEKIVVGVLTVAGLVSQVMAWRSRVNATQRIATGPSASRPPTPLWLLAFVPLFFMGCGVLTTNVPAEWVAADRATYNAVAPEHTKYIQADPALTQEQKDRRLRTLETWETRLTEHEKALPQRNP